jgi:shikimate dehydrogenase
MPPTVVSHFAVLGSPIAHSKSPLLHHAAISVLGVDADYVAHEVTASEFPRFLAAQDDDALGFSLTMPLKHVVRPLLASECEMSALTGAVNTVVRRSDGWHGFNTDVWGAQTAITQSLGARFDTATVLGGGATAASVLVALRNLEVRDVNILVRNTQKTLGIEHLATRLGLNCCVGELGANYVRSDILVNTLPASAELELSAIEVLDSGALFDVAYNPWPSSLAREWIARGLPTSSGLLMLLWQAVLQARIFYGDGIDVELPHEAIVVTAMRSSVGL